MKRYVVFIIAGFLLTSCNKDEGQTVESAYIDPLTLPVIYKYNFTRNGISSVDLLEQNILSDNLNLFMRPIRRADIFNQESRNEVMELYTNGRYDVKPETYVATSSLHSENQAKIKADILAMIDIAARVSGFDLPDNSKDGNKGNLATEGKTGHLRDGNTRIYVDEKGLVFHEALNRMLMGAIYLDRMLNYHLDEQILNDEKLRTAHENVELITGKNYTELEHHWDLAYGYFSFWRTLSQPDGIPALRGSELKIFNAFVLGRTELNRYRYADMQIHLKTIRAELSKVVAARAMYYLTNANTRANLKEGDGSDAFSYISNGYGLLYALQFTRNEEGKPYISYERAKELANYITNGRGLWNNGVLASEAWVEGSLMYIATEVGKSFGLSLPDVQR